jgi:hypothetical protein
MGRCAGSITIETDDCQKTFEEPKARGVEFVSDVLEFPGARSRSSTTPTATGYRYERAGSPQSENGLAPRSRLALLRLSTSGSAGAPAPPHLLLLRSARLAICSEHPFGGESAHLGATAFSSRRPGSARSRRRDDAIARPKAPPLSEAPRNCGSPSLGPAGSDGATP